MADQNLNFTRFRNGYDPQEVDAVIIELQRQIADLKQRNAAFSNAVTQYDDKVRQLAENTKQLQDERIQESLRMTGLMSSAARMAEQIERDALNRSNEITKEARRETKKILENAEQEAEKIRSQAQDYFIAIRTALIKLSESTQNIRQHNEQYLTGANKQLIEITTFVNSALKAIPTESPLYTAPVSPVAVPLQVSKSAATAPPIPAANPDPYDDFVKNLKLTGQQPQYPPSQKSQ